MHCGCAEGRTHGWECRHERERHAQDEKEAARDQQVVAPGESRGRRRQSRAGVVNVAGWAGQNFIAAPVAESAAQRTPDYCRGCSPLPVRLPCIACKSPSAQLQALLPDDLARARLLPVRRLPTQQSPMQEPRSDSSTHRATYLLYAMLGRNRLWREKS
jgi:hypothetical protein